MILKFLEQDSYWLAECICFSLSLIKMKRKTCCEELKPISTTNNGKTEKNIFGDSGINTWMLDDSKGNVWAFQNWTEQKSVFNITWPEF